MTRRTFLLSAAVALVPREKPLRLEGTVLYTYYACPDLILKVTRVIDSEGEVAVLNPPRAKRVRLENASDFEAGSLLTVTGTDLGRGRPLLATDAALLSAGPERPESDTAELSPVVDAQIVPKVALEDGTRLEGRRLVTLLATGYGPGENGIWGDQTRLETTVGYGTVAVDPRVIPLRTRLWVEGYGFCIALDVGGAIKGNRIDLGFDSDEEANRYGRQHRRVLILGS